MVFSSFQMVRGYRGMHVKGIVTLLSIKEALCNAAALTVGSSLIYNLRKAACHGHTFSCGADWKMWRPINQAGGRDWEQWPAIGTRAPTAAKPSVHHILSLTHTHTAYTQAHNHRFVWIGSSQADVLPLPSITKSKLSDWKKKPNILFFSCCIMELAVYIAMCSYMYKALGTG